jgi:hypothetical protein
MKTKHVKELGIGPMLHLLSICVLIAGLLTTGVRGTCKDEIGTIGMQDLTHAAFPKNVVTKLKNIKVWLKKTPEVDYLTKIALVHEKQGGGEMETEI